jgi:hypothetical protein
MPADDPRFDVLLTGDDIEVWGGRADGENQSLVDLVNRVLDKGVCITGDVTISVAGVDLVYLGLNAILTSVATARARVDPTAGPRRPGDGGAAGPGATDRR